MLRNEIEYLHARASYDTHENSTSHSNAPSNNQLLHGFNLPSFDGISITYIWYDVKPILNFSASLNVKFVLKFPAPTFALSLRLR